MPGSLRVLRSVSCVVAALLLWATPTFAQTAAVTRNVNLRSDASTNQQPIRLLTPSEPPLTLIEPAATAGYYHVQTSAGEQGWVWSHNVTITAAPTPAPTPTPTPSPTPSLTPSPTPIPTPSPSPSVGGTFAISNPSCPSAGTHNVNGQPVPYGGTTDAGLRNKAKRHIPMSGTPLTLTLTDLAALQHQVNIAFADASTTKTVFTPSRDGLKSLTVTAGTVSEGELVQLAGFLTIARAEGPESLNCAGLDGTDIHLNVGSQGATEFAGVVAEMIPELPRPTGWDPTTLTRISQAQLPILLVGGLTYDNEHFVNGNPQHPKSGQPKRMSLWEIHPIIEFYVCRTSACDPAQHGQWQTLTDWANANPIHQ